MDAKSYPYSAPPPPSLNGGLYTGAPFTPEAPWRNFPATPDVSYMVHQNLKSAHPPPGADTQYPGSIRPGNNFQDMPGVTWYGAQNSLMCGEVDPKACGQQQPSDADTSMLGPFGSLLNQQFAKYAYLP